MSDNDLVQLIRNKDINALKEIYKRYERLTYSFAMRLLGNGQEAEEVVQDVFMKLWDKSALFDTEGNSKFSSWLLKICKNAAIDRLKKRRNNHVDIENLAGMPDIRIDLVSEIEFASLQKRIKEALRKLPDEQREIIEMIYFYGFTQSDVAEKTGIPLGTVKSRVKLGLTKLKKLLAREVINANA